MMARLRGDVMRIVRAGVMAVAFAAGSRLILGAADSCDGLRGVSLSGASVTATEWVAAGAFVAPGGGGAAQTDALKSLPAFCRVAATLRPTADSDIKIEVWMPAANWNGKLQAVGNGGWSGSIPYGAMVAALGRGYATSSTDTGHTGSSASFALGHPEKLIDFGYRAVHEMTVTARRLVAGFYGRNPRRVYWNGCSAGGRQGLKEAQRFPADYDGIIAGAPAADWAGRAAAAMRTAQAMHKDDASFIPREKYTLLHDAVLRQCDRLDGVQDGVLEDPTRCRFDPGILECSGAEGPTCLTRSQVEAARQVYVAAENPRTGRAITSLEPGSELGWATWGGAQPFAIGRDFFRYVVFKNPDWDSRTFKFDRDIVDAEDADAGTISALDPNLQPFLARGGKLLQYHGWSDPQISPGNSVQYYQRVSERLGGRSRIHGSYRLFMVPGMAHCGGGEGPNRFDAITALEQWVEHGHAPDVMMASLQRDGSIARTRPLCPYPQVAAYKGAGSTDDAANFVCSAR